MENSFILKGNVCYCRTPDTLEVEEGAYLVCEQGRSAGVYREVPERFKGLPVTDFGDRILTPGMVDLHLHAPQYSFRSLGMDLELLEWLDTHTFPEESRYADLDYADRAYAIFADSMKHGAATRACIFATLHVEATELLMDKMEATGMKTYVGKVNMDRNAMESLCEAGPERSAGETVRWLEETAGRYRNVLPILTPRFIPSCSDELMERLAAIQKQYRLPVQSHLSENQGEIDWVKELCPWSEFYGDAYDHFGLFGGECRTVMAHCVHSDEREQQRMGERGVFVAHCPQSNMNLSSGIAPVRQFLERGIRVGLGSDVAGGHTESMFRAVADAVQVSKMRWRLLDQGQKPLSWRESFYLATKGGGAFFGQVGSFETGYEMDVLVLDDSRLARPRPLTVSERLERLVYLADDREIAGKYVAGQKVL